MVVTLVPQNTDLVSFRCIVLDASMKTYTK